MPIRRPTSGYRVLSAAVLLCLAALPAAAQAQAAESSFRFSGFGTLGAVTTDTSATQFRSDVRQPRGAGTGPDLGVDSKLGLQGNLKLDQNLSLVGQVLTSRRYSDRPVVEWLYGEAQLPAGFSAKVGRMVLPVFMVSEVRSVGFASHWIRPPTEVYLIYPASYFDGGQLQFRNPVGPIHLTLQVSAGSMREKLSFDGFDATFKSSRLQSVNAVAEWGDWSLRFGHLAARDVQLKGMPFAIPNGTDRFTGVGLRYDDHTALLMAEYVTRRGPEFSVFESNSWYVSGGWRFGAWMPYATVSRVTPNGNSILIQPSSTKAVGVRWDVSGTVALKAQFERTDWQGAFVQSTPRFLAEPAKINVYSLAVDFIF